VVSPILANVYVDKLDQFVEQTLIPAYTQGNRRQVNPQYTDVSHRRQRARARGDHEQVRQLTDHLRRLPFGDPQDPHYRRLRYVRYADDFLLAFIGPKAEAEEIKQRLASNRHTVKRQEPLAEEMPPDCAVIGAHSISPPFRQQTMPPVGMERKRRLLLSW
jgi:hypothetical protein